MHPTYRVLAAALLLGASASPNPALGQFGTAFPGFVQLPADDFTWLWGGVDENDFRGAPDFNTRGGEAGFMCDLTGRLRVSSRMTSQDIRNLEQSLQTSLAFIQVSAETMTVLDRRFELDWAKLDCKKQEGNLDEEEQQERLDRALEKAIRDRERRRARDRDD